MAILSEFKNRPKLVLLKLTLIFVAYLSLLLALGFGFSTIPNLVPQDDKPLLIMFCWTAITTSISAWVIWLLPRISFAAVALLCICLACFFALKVETAGLTWRFSFIASAVTATIIFSFRLANVSVLSPQQWRGNQNFQFSLSAMMIAFVVTSAFFSTRAIMETISSSVGWEICNIVLFSLIDAALTVGIFISVLRPKYILVSLPLAAIVFVGFTALSIHWMPTEQFADKWSPWRLVGRQTLMHSAIVLAPLIVVRLLGYRIGGQSSVTTPAVGQEDCLSHS